MKSGIVPTRHEVLLGPQDVIVSKTDTTGRMTYVNRTFMRIANYAESDVLQKQHNIIRHPDMPRGVFKLLWDTLKDGREFFGYVKNLTSAGDYYWVFANITEDLDASGKLIGYFSVRKQAKPEAIAVIQPIYEEMLEIERKTGAASAPVASVAMLTDKLKSMGTTYDKFVLTL
ncbi:MAG: PAS domain-containing protein [Sideroxyarcus sp.]|nr:PAS domain-containing protein [Sideroxyarcus sp.]